MSSLYRLAHPLPPSKLDPSSPKHPFLISPFVSPLLFENNSSDARDHLANERTFLSWLKLSVYMAIVSVAIMISFHLKNEPSVMEMRIALPVGLVFWALSFACLGNGCANYVKTVAKYGRRAALVQSGWKTQVVSLDHFPVSNGLGSMRSLDHSGRLGASRIRKSGDTDNPQGLHGCSLCDCRCMCPIPVCKCRCSTIAKPVDRIPPSLPTSSCLM